MQWECNTNCRWPTAIANQWTRVSKFVSLWIISKGIYESQQATSDLEVDKAALVTKAIINPTNAAATTFTVPSQNNLHQFPSYKILQSTSSTRDYDASKSIADTQLPHNITPSAKKENTNQRKKYFFFGCNAKTDGFNRRNDFIIITFIIYLFI